MTDFFSYLLETSLILIVLYSGFFFVLRDKAAPSFNRLYLLLSLPAAFIIPLIHLPLQAAASGAAPLVWQPATQAWNYLPELVVYANKADAGQAAANSINWLQLGGYIYFAGLLFSLMLSASRIAQLLKWLRKLPFRYAGDYSYLLAPTGGRFPTFSFLNYIFWDDTAPLSQEEARQVLRHEEAHVKEGHSYDILLLELLTALLWFNPFIYLYRHAVRQVHEHLADRHALQEGEQQAYLQLMVRQTLRQANLPLVSTFFQHNTLNRIRMIQTKPSKPLLRAFFGLSLAASVFFVAACEDETEQSVPETAESMNFPETLDIPFEPAIPSESETPSNEGSNTEQVFEVVEHQPTPKGGIEAFYKFVGKELRYPEQAERLGVEGRVFVQFIVDERGLTSEVKTVKGVGAGLDGEAERVIKLSKWEPGTQKGKAVKVRMIMPVSFKLNE
jgi:TonB family protein